MLVRNIQLVSNSQVLKQKKTLDYIMHNIRCEGNYRKSINIQMEQYKKSVMSVNQKAHRREQRIIEREKQAQQQALDRVAHTWLVATAVLSYGYGLYKIYEKAKEKKIMKYLLLNFKGRIRQVTDKICDLYMKQRSFGFRQFSWRDKIRMDANLCLRLFASKIKRKRKIQSALKVKQHAMTALLKSHYKNVIQRVFLIAKYTRYLQRWFRQKKSKLVNQILLIIEILILRIRSKGEVPEQYKPNLEEIQLKLATLSQDLKIKIATKYYFQQQIVYKKMFLLILGKIEPTESDYTFKQATLPVKEAEKNSKKYKAELINYFFLAIIFFFSINFT